MIRSSLCSLTACAVLAGCASVPPFPEPDKTWQSFNGQLQYITKERRVIGEFEASSRNGDFRLQFTKGGSVPLIRVSRHQQYARAEGAFARGHWQGIAAKAPAPLLGWVTEVPRGFTGIGPVMVAARIASLQQGAIGGGDHPRRMEIQGTQPGERFVFVFDR